MFQHTYLYIKRHAITGKLYFGKTVSKDPVKYLGSGKHWSPHVKKHGKEHVETLWYCLFLDQEELIKFATLCSAQWDIVKSDDWLNLINENGLGGAPFGYKATAEHRAKNSISQKNKKKGPQSPEHKANTSIALKGKSKSIEHCKNIAAGKKDKKFSAEHCKNISIAKIGTQRSPESVEKSAASNRRRNQDRSEGKENGQH